MPKCDSSDWVSSMLRAWIFYASKAAVVSRSKELPQTATVAPRGGLNSLLPSRQSAIKQPTFSVLLRGPGEALHASGHRRLQVRQQERRVHRGGVPTVLLGDRYDPRVYRYQYLPIRRSKSVCPDAWESLCVP